jgi:hypothetical protein
MVTGPSKDRKSRRRTPQQGAATPVLVSNSAESMQRRVASLISAQLFCAGAVFLVALLLYSWTLAPTVTLTDSGELIVVACGLGVAHPPGVPLWTILAHLASLVPLGNIAMRINFSSAVFGALACAMLTLVVAELIITASYLAAAKRRKRGSKKTEELGITRLMVAAPALGGGLLMAFSRTLWSYATITEVYSLNALLIVVIFFLMFRWRWCIVEDKMHFSTASNAGQVTRHDGFLYSAAVIFGLALGVHHVTVALTLPAIALMVFRTQGVRFFTSRRLVYAALISVVALVAIYAYLPLAASHSPVINWGKPRSLQEIWWHITGRQYQVYFSFQPEIMGKQFGEFCRMALREFGFPLLPLPLVLALVGFANVFKRDRTTFWFLITVVVANLVYDLNYEIAEDKDAYYLPVFISIAIAAGLGIQSLLQLLVSKQTAIAKPLLAAATVILLTCTIACAGNWPFNNRRQYFIAHDYAENLLSAIAPDGLLLTLDWQVASPMFYMQEIEQHRRDVKVIDINLLRRSWYFDYLARAYPEMIERSREKMEAFVQNLKEWERDPGAFARNPALTQRISASFLEMIQSIVTKEVRVAPVYITNELLTTDSMNGELTRWLGQNYQPVPEGLVFNLVSDRGFHNLPDLHLQTRGLADGTIRFERDDVVNVKVLPAYARMLSNRGRYLAMFNQYEPAAAAYKDALALNPNLVPAQQGLAEVTAKLHSQ